MLSVGALTSATRICTAFDIVASVEGATHLLVNLEAEAPSRYPCTCVIRTVRNISLVKLPNYLDISLIKQTNRSYFCTSTKPHAVELQQRTSAHSLMSCYTSGVSIPSDVVVDTKLCVARSTVRGKNTLTTCKSPKIWQIPHTALEKF